MIEEREKDGMLRLRKGERGRGRDRDRVSNGGEREGKIVRKGYQSSHRSLGFICRTRAGGKTRSSQRYTQRTRHPCL